VPVAGEERAPIVVAGTPFEERMGAFSPDGHWVAYDTERSGRYEVIVQAFPEPDEEFPVSTDGGMAPLWSADGREICFTAPGGELMVAVVATTASAFAAEKPVVLFPARVGPQPFNQEYAVTKNRRFLVNSIQVDDRPAPITVVLNLRP
jgi:eukaryotic-like serine/threonine-protein kinase